MIIYTSSSAPGVQREYRIPSEDPDAENTLYITGPEKDLYDFFTAHRNEQDLSPYITGFQEMLDFLKPGHDFLASQNIDFIYRNLSDNLISAREHIAFNKLFEKTFADAASIMSYISNHGNTDIDPHTLLQISSGKSLLTALSGKQMAHDIFF